MVGEDFDVGDAAEEVDTLGGYLVTRVGRVPVRGELSRARPASSSRCWTPIRAASSSVRIHRGNDRNERRRGRAQLGAQAAIAGAAERAAPDLPANRDRVGQALRQTTTLARAGRP